MGPLPHKKYKIICFALEWEEIIRKRMQPLPYRS